MSDIKNLHRAYAAVYDSEIKENLKQSRDEISAMSLTQMNDVDLYEVAEEVLEEVFAKNSDIVEAEKLIESVFIKASEGVESEGRADKIERLGEAFASAFARVKEKSIRTAVESYSDYRRGKEIISKRNDDPNNDLSKLRLHNALVAEDRRVVKSGLLSMIESVGSAVDKALGAVGDSAKEVGKAADAAPKIGSKILKKAGKAVGRVVGTPIGVAKSIKKGFQDGTKSEGYEATKTKEVLSALKRDKRPLDKKTKSKIAADIVAKKGDTSKSDDRYAYEAYTVTAADKKGNTPAYQGLKSGKKNVKTGEPMYKAADHLKKEELEATGLFSEHEIKKLLWTEFIEGYQRNPEKGEKEDKRSVRQKRMDDPEKGINSPAFQQFMRDRGLS